MPCSCFGKKDTKKGGVLGEEEKYRPRDSRERDPPTADPISVSTTGAPLATKAQAQPLLGAAPPPSPSAAAAAAAAPGTPPPSPALTTTPTPGGDPRLRPEDDPDKATRRRDVVASFYSDQCELIGFKATGSRPPSAHVGGQDGPAATSSITSSSSPGSTRSGGAFCRADLAEKRREFFRDLTGEEDDLRVGSRPTSRLTDPGSQQTPRHSHYQDQLHHTLPHLHKTSPRSNQFSSSTPLVLQHSLPRNAKNSPKDDSSWEDTQPLLIHSSSELSPKISPKKSDRSVSKIPKMPNVETSHATYVNEDDNENTPLLGESPSPPDTLLIESHQMSPEMSLKFMDQSSLENKLKDVSSELEYPELLVDITPTDKSEVIVDTTPLKSPELNVIFPTEPTESSKLIVDAYTLESPEINVEKSPTENSHFLESSQPIPVINEDIILSKNESHVPTEVFASPQVVVDVPSMDNEKLLLNMSVPENPPSVDDHVVIDPQLNVNIDAFMTSTPKVEPFIQYDSQTDNRETYLVESPVSLDKQFDIEFSPDPLPQTLPIIINETLKEQHKQPTEQHMNFEVTPQDTYFFTLDGHEEQTPQTIVETTRQFISASPDEQKTSQTIVETTRQFITGPSDEEQTTRTIVETTQHYISGSPDEEKKMEAPQTIVETTRQFISRIPEDDEEEEEEDGHGFIEHSQPFFSGSSDEQICTTVTSTQQQFVSGSPDDQVTQTIVQTTQQFVSGHPEEQITQTTVETTQLPPSVNPFFLTSAEEPDELPQKLLLQSAPQVTLTQTINKPPQVTLTHVEPVEEEEEEAEEEEMKMEEPKLPEEPCFGVPPPPASPPPPLPEEEEEEEEQTMTTEVSLTSPIAVVIPPGEEEPLPPAPPTPPAELEVTQPKPSAPILDEEQFKLESDPLNHTPPTPPTPHEDIQDLPPAPPTPPMPRLDDVQLSSTPPMENELLPPTPPTPHREDELPPAPLTPSKKDELSSPTPPTPPLTSPPRLPPVTCGVEIVSSSTLEDDGLGSEIDDALESLEGISEEGNIARAAASS